jgi:transcriptional regulator with GAF, ATPase, and Fis domain
VSGPDARSPAEETARPDAVRAATADVERERLWRLLALGRGLAAHRTREALCDAVADAALALTEAERAFVVLLDDDGRARVEASRNFDREAVRGAEEKISRTVVERVLAAGAPLASEDAGADPALSAEESVGRLRLRSILCVPLRVDARASGAIYVENRFRAAAFGAGERRLLEALADAAAAAIEARRGADAAERRRASAEEAAQAYRGAAETQRLELARLAEALLARRDEPGPREDRPLVGRSPAMRRVLALLDRVADSEAPVLVTGESGTGKELVARTLHRRGPRREGPFVAESCAALPEALVESELFGHVRGAFTGAVEDRPGLFELARGGTLFLDEVGDMPLAVQKKLLRVLQEGEVRRLGGERPIAVDARIMAATHRDLADLVRRGEFREDLYYRLCVLEVRLPTLRERAEDIPDLVARFLAEAGEETGAPPKRIAREAVRMLARRGWPGNVRELANAVKRLAALGQDPIGEADVRDLLDRAPVRPARGAAPLLTLEEVERAHVERVLDACRGRPVEAAKALGIGYTTLWRKMKAWGLKRGAPPRAER